MGPKAKKAGGNKPSKKNVEKKKEKLAHDKTFGLKNKKKSKAVQQFVQQVHQQVKGTSLRQERDKIAKAVKKEQESAALLNLFQSAITQPKLAPGTDPKSVVCEFFKQNACKKGARCKYSHDLNVGRKVAKIDLYSDKREQEDQIQDWDQSKLETVIEQKHGAANQTDIVCKYFLDAIEKSQYGWFWTCPNGGKACKYRHALPPGYVFKTKAERELERHDKTKEISVEEIIEQERKKLGVAGGTPVTAITLAKWKEDKAKRKAEALEVKRKEAAKKSGGRGLNILSGRALFSYDPTLFRDDDAADVDEYEPTRLNEEENDVLEDDIQQLAQIIDRSLYVNPDEAVDLEQHQQQ